MSDGKDNGDRSDTEDYRDRYDALVTAVQDLMCELRIRPEDLGSMSQGYSPSYPGVFDDFLPAVNVVQISKVVVGKLLPHINGNGI